MLSIWPQAVWTLTVPALNCFIIVLLSDCPEEQIQFSFNLQFNQLQYKNKGERWLLHKTVRRLLLACGLFEYLLIQCPNHNIMPLPKAGENKFVVKAIINDTMCHYIPNDTINFIIKVASGWWFFVILISLSAVIMKTFFSQVLPHIFHIFHSLLSFHRWWCLKLYNDFIVFKIITCRNEELHMIA